MSRKASARVRRKVGRRVAGVVVLEGRPNVWDMYEVKGIGVAVAACCASRSAPAAPLCSSALRQHNTESASYTQACQPSPLSAAPDVAGSATGAGMNVPSKLNPALPSSGKGGAAVALRLRKRELARRRRWEGCFSSFAIPPGCSAAAAAASGAVVGLCTEGEALRSSAAAGL